jgi:excisionase family DNA binding protein
MPVRERDQPGSDDPWLTPAEIAAELRVNAATIRLWISKGMLPATRVGQRRLLVRGSDVMRLLAKRSTAGGVNPYRRSQQLADAPPVRGGWSTSNLLARQAENPHEIHAAARRLQDAELAWEAAQAASANPPPDPGFGGRVRDLAVACEWQAKALEAAAHVEGFVWTPEPDARDMVLSYELRPGARRPGPRGLWREFDAAVRRLGRAMEGSFMSVVASAYADLAIVMHKIADVLEEDQDRKQRARDATERKASARAVRQRKAS